MKILAPVLAMGVLLVAGGCPPPEEPAAPPREPVRPAEPVEPRPTEPADPARPAPHVDDQQIEQQLRQQIQQDQTLSPTAHQEVMIEVRNGNVTLRGQVETQQESRRIEDLALQIQGVQDVNNQLEIAMEDPMGDPMGDPDDPYGDPS